MDNATNQEQNIKTFTCTCSKCGKLEAFSEDSGHYKQAAFDRHIRRKVANMTPTLGAVTGSIIYALGGAVIGGVGDFIGLKKEGMSLAKIGSIIGVFAGGARGLHLGREAVKSNSFESEQLSHLCQDCDSYAYEMAGKFSTP